VQSNPLPIHPNDGPGPSASPAMAGKIPSDAVRVKLDSMKQQGQKKQGRVGATEQLLLLCLHAVRGPADTHVGAGWCAFQSY